MREEHDEGLKKSSVSKQDNGPETGHEELYEHKLDQALADTFPASDPLPWTSDFEKMVKPRARRKSYEEER